MSSPSSLSDLNKAWKQRHLGLRDARAQQVKGPQPSACMAAGVCHCRRAIGQKRHLGLLWQTCRQRLQRRFGRQKNAALDEGQVVLMWTGHMDGEVYTRFTHISLQFWRPWRPTTLEMQRVGREGDELIQNVLHDRPITVEQERFVTLACVVDAEGVPCFRTIWEFMASLAEESLLEASWRITVLFLSQHQTPFPNSAGLVRVYVEAGEESPLFWLGLGRELEERRLARRPAFLLAEQQDNPEQDVNDDREELLPEGEEAEGEEAVEGAWPDGEVEALLEEQQQEALDNAQQSSSSSSSSSSSTTSSSSTSSRSSSASSQTRSSQGRQRSSSPPSSNNNNQDDVAQAAEAVGVPRAARVETFQWGRFRFTYKVPNSYFVVCRYHQPTARGTHCTKSASWSTDAERTECIRKLKSWCLCAVHHPDRVAHMGPRGVPDVHPDHEHLGDNALDELERAMPNALL